MILMNIVIIIDFDSSFFHFFHLKRIEINSSKWAINDTFRSIRNERSPRFNVDYPFDDLKLNLLEIFFDLNTAFCSLLHKNEVESGSYLPIIFPIDILVHQFRKIDSDLTFQTKMK